MTARIGIDIGGTKIAAGVVEDEEPTRVQHRLTVPTPAGHEVMAAVAEVIATLRAKVDVHSIGIGAPGVIDPLSKTVVSAGPTMPGWAGTDIGAHIELPVAVHNDVRVMGLGESVFGAGRGRDNVLFVSLGTGVGGAIVRGGNLVASPNHTAGELRALWGVLPDGRAAVVEEIASGPALARHYNASGQFAPAADLREIMQRINDGCAESAAYISSLLRACGQTIAGFASAIDVDAIVIGGGVGNIGAFVIDAFTAGFREHALQPVDQIPIMQAQLGTDAPIVGAAYLSQLTREKTHGSTNLL